LLVSVNISGPTLLPAVLIEDIGWSHGALRMHGDAE
jgi:hypothetical protein